MSTSNNLLQAASRETAAQILAGGAGLLGFGEDDFRKADAAMQALQQRTARGEPVPVG